MDRGGKRIQVLLLLYDINPNCSFFFIVLQKTADFHIFIESAHWADSIIESRCPYVCLSVPFHAIFFEASHWPSDHMTRSRPLIGQPSFPTIWWWWGEAICRLRPLDAVLSSGLCGKGGGLTSHDRLNSSENYMLLGRAG